MALNLRRRFEIFQRDGFRCRYCGDTEKLQVDHINPVSRGGTDDPENLITACWPCNIGKKDSMAVILPDLMERIDELEMQIVDLKMLHDSEVENTDYGVYSLNKFQERLDNEQRRLWKISEQKVA